MNRLASVSVLSLLTLVSCTQASHKNDIGSTKSSANPALAGRHALPSFQEAISSKRDLWGEAAMRQPNGPSYEFFENLLPPPRYVNSDFRFYPIVLSAPNAKLKARLISNGSGVNVRGGTKSWHDVGTAATFRVGPDELRFGEFLDRLEHPTLAEGYLPIPEIRYAHDRQVYKLEAFVATAPELAENAIVFVKFSLASGSNNLITVEFDSPAALSFADGKVTNAKGQVLAYFDQNWTWERERAHAKIGTRKSATLAIATKPLESSANFSFIASSYDEHRKHCVESWQKVLAGGMSVEVPEPRVNNAWRHLLIQNFELIQGDRMHYSSGNQYGQLYEAEGSDAALGMMLWGFEADTRRLIPTLLDFTRKNLEFHQAGHKLDDICRYYWQTRDADFVKAMRPRWEKEVQRIVVSRTNQYGLFPKEQYCGDIATPVYSLNSNAKCWAALRDFVPVLNEIGEKTEAERIAKVAAEFRRSIVTGLNKSIRHEVKPPFVPIALFGDEEVHDPITHSRIGGYWNLMANYIIGTRILDGDRETWLPHYLETHGGLCMGLTRSGAQPTTFWTGIPRTNPLYGLRYAIDTLRRDDVDRALVNFYGMLAHGFTRNTFIGAEGCSLTPLDEGGRIFYCPPNSASNAEWLWVLRHLLVQDFDRDADGTPETLRLLFATPRVWLADGKTIKVERAPTVFGSVSLSVQSKLAQGEVIVEVDLPQRNAPKQTLLRARVPQGWRVISAIAEGQQLRTDAQGTVDITSLKGKAVIHFHVKKS
jgi:hypothetical protein